MADKLGRISPSRLSGSEPIHERGRPLGTNTLEFWQWAGSDLVSNTFRGWLAEYIVGLALGATKRTRLGWEPFDFRTRAGARIEVKASAYIQSWKQSKLATPRFAIPRTFAWDPESNTYSDLPARHSDAYVFCLHKHTDQRTLDPLDVGQWTFFVLSTATIEREATHQKTIGISTLRRLGAREVPFRSIRHAVNSVTGAK